MRRRLVLESVVQKGVKAASSCHRDIASRVQFFYSSDGELDGMEWNES